MSEQRLSAQLLQSLVRIEGTECDLFDGVRVRQNVIGMARQSKLTGPLRTSMDRQPTLLSLLESRPL